MARVRDYTVIDLEMTGLAAKTDKIIEIGAVRVRGGAVADTYRTFVNPGRPVPAEITALTGITDEMAASGEPEDEAVSELLDFVGKDVLVGHNIGFDYGFLKQWAVNHRHPLQSMACDTLRMARALLPGEQSKRLECLCVYFHIERARAHRALEDALETWQVYEHLAAMAEEKAPKLLEPRALTCKVRRQTPATAHQIERLKEFRSIHHMNDEICWDTLTRSQASRLQDQYYAAYGRPPAREPKQISPRQEAPGACR